MRAILSLLLVTSTATAHADALFGKSLHDRMLIEKSVVCSDGKTHFVAVVPHDRQLHQLFYGDGKKFFRVPPPPWAIPGTEFLDPRFFNKGGNPDFRGVDMRLYSSVEPSEARDVCKLRCGERQIEWKAIGEEAAKKLLTEADFQPSPQTREPYALARDQTGVYYYVDRGTTDDTKKNFKLYVGRKGALKLQQMRDVVSDSNGEIFATRTGTLRFVLEKDADPLWVVGKHEKKLKRLPVGENLQLIYTELGVYQRMRLETPCEDL